MKCATFYSYSKAETIINKRDINDVFESIFTTVASNIQKFLGKGSGSTIDSVIDHTISVSKYDSLAGRSYIRLKKELDHLRRGLIIMNGLKRV